MGNIKRNDIYTAYFNPVSSETFNVAYKPLMEDISKIKNEGDKNMDKICNLLEIYRKKSLAKIDFDCDNDIKFIRETSDLYLILEKIRKQAEEEFSKLYPNIENPQDYFYIDIKATPQINEQVERRIQERDEEIDKLNKNIEEAKSLLAIADTFEQKMEILRNYEVINEKGQIEIW